MKCAIVRPTKPYLQKTLHSFSYRIAAYKNLLAQLFPDNRTPEKHTEGRRTFNRCSLKFQVMSFCPFLLFLIRGLLNIFTGVKATPEQSHDLLTFHKVGIKDVENHTFRQPNVCFIHRSSWLLLDVSREQQRILHRG